MIEMTIPTMTCGHCVQTVTRTAQRLDPEARVEADVPSHRVRIETRADPSALRAALADEGYAPLAAA